MNVTIKNQTHASTNPYKTVCGLALTKRCKPTGVKVTCPICQEKEEKATESIRAYIQKLLTEVESGLPLEAAMWRLTGYTQETLRSI